MVRGDLLSRGAPQDAVVWGDIEQGGRPGGRGLVGGCFALAGQGFLERHRQCGQPGTRSGQEPSQAQFGGHVTRIRSAISHLLPFASGVSVSAETGSAWLVSCPDFFPGKAPVTAEIFKTA